MTKTTTILCDVCGKAQNVGDEYKWGMIWVGKDFPVQIATVKDLCPACYSKNNLQFRITKKEKP